MALPWTVSSLLATTVSYLADRGSPSARLDAELLLAAALQVDRVDLYLQHDRPITPLELGSFRDLVRRRARREPVAYILGRAYFRYLTLAVTPAVLIPRPETEELVDVVLEWLTQHPAEMWQAAMLEESADRPEVDGAATSWRMPSICDVGTGSGAIALSLACERGLRVLAVDSSEEALAVAAQNAERLGLSEQVKFRRGDLLGDVPPRSMGLVVSNPPYVSDGEWLDLSPDVRNHEPPGALRGGADGMDVYRRLLPQAVTALMPGGRLFVEVGAGQAPLVAQLAAESGFCGVQVQPDLAGKQRFVSAAVPGAPILSIAQVLAAADGESRARPGDRTSTTGQDESEGGGSPGEREGGLLEALRRALAAGGLIGIPTDTVYGLAAAWGSGKGQRALREAKGRDAEKPFQVLFSSVEAVREALPQMGVRSLLVLEGLLPGPYTFVVSTSASRAEAPGGTEDSLGIRVPGHPELLELLAALRVPLAATSANLSGDSAALDHRGVPGEVAAACAVLLTAQAAAPPGGTASTVVDLRPLDKGREPVVLREGAVGTSEVLERIRVLLS